MNNLKNVINRRLLANGDSSRVVIMSSIKLMDVSTHSSMCIALVEKGDVMEEISMMISGDTSIDIKDGYNVIKKGDYVGIYKRYCKELKKLSSIIEDTSRPMYERSKCIRIKNMKKEIIMELLEIIRTEKEVI